MEQQRQQQQQQSRWPYVKAQVPAPPNLMASADIARLLPEDALLSELMEMDGLMDTISEPWPAMVSDSGFSSFNFSFFITSPDSSSSFYAVCSPSAPFNAQPSGLVRADSGAMYSLPCNSSGFSPSMVSPSTTSLPQLILQEDVLMASASQDIPDKQIDDVHVLLLKRYWRMEFFKISGDGRAVYAGREFWRLQWSSLSWGKIRLYMSLIKVPSFAGIGLLPIK